VVEVVVVLFAFVCRFRFALLILMCFDVF